jgi:hypothetical protein
MMSDLLIGYSVESILGRAVPYVANLTMNALIIRALIKSKRRVSQNNTVSQKEYSFAYSLLVQNFIFVILTLPFFVTNILQLNVKLCFTFFKFLLNMNIKKKVFSFGAWGNYFFEASPFFMNIAFNKTFRIELYALLNLRKARFSSSDAENNTTTRKWRLCMNRKVIGSNNTVNNTTI